MSTRALAVLAVTTWVAAFVVWGFLAHTVHVPR